ncbi:MAG: tRNA (N6-isopentenyl adenosine(37)-C2)-methylthiotransferase MiaB [Pseudomonadota bacterium]|nr:tRNA (N6-isopentenyl adenosine(37)-C2)-methylthiotransferase MiaB [Pseudomonadota bacterium]
MEKKRLYIKTYGCQMNVYDSGRMSDTMVANGYEIVDDSDTADVILLNTCHIREKAAEKIYSELGRYKALKEKNPKLKIGVAGCVAQAEGEEVIRRQPLVDLVVGPQSYHRLPVMLSKLKTQKKSVDTEFPLEDKFLHLPIPEKNKRSSPSAFLTVQEGCDKFCAFCVVPYTRGSEISRPPDQILFEAEDLVERGAVEITLLGQNVNGYSFCSSTESCDFASLIRRVVKIEKLKRLRFTTSHPIDMTESLIDCFGTEEKLMPYLHLPVQSGSDRILKAMNRRHTKNCYIDIIRRVREKRPDIAISGDFIVGFPGETSRDFEETLELCRNVNYAQAYSFKYSARPGTPAAGKEEVSEKQKVARLAKIQDLLQQQKNAFQAKMVGRTFPILIEKKGKEPGQVVGRSPYLQPVFLEGSHDLMGQIVNVKIKAFTNNSLEGSLDLAS